MPLFGFRRGTARRGATPRRKSYRVDKAAFDRWLDRAVAIAVMTALLVSALALLLTLLR
jgi:hypothetical protein